jgi:hypothetical protein
MPSRGQGCDHLCREMVVDPGGCEPLLSENELLQQFVERFKNVSRVVHGGELRSSRDKPESV